ncbi:unnamed protein product [Candidula unifasciata]|uniref:D-dopachrome decarboxylase n=1 Tax=Candidula unifasciata TaxID=100452 RepID=A0A8S4AAD5_9EUPU|nr:unnamed protein product [Candidula unifasciata]
MPLIYLHTNLEASALKDGIELRIAKTVGDIIDKPIENMLTIIVPGVRLLRQETTEPAATLNIYSVGSFDSTRNATYTPAVKQLVKSELGIPEERIIVVYHDLDINFVG